MSKALAPGLLFSSLFISITVAVNACNCEMEGFWSVENIQECQRVSDFLIAVAYFSIPLELLYFVSCSNLPFKWVLFEFIAFIVLCGLTHLINGWTYTPHTFQLMLALTIFKFLTALVSCATAITLITLIPLLLKVKVREFMLKKKARDLRREVGLIECQKETVSHVRMLTHEIRKSLDRNNILHTTMVELSKTLNLHSCAIWMPNETKDQMILTHELIEGEFLDFRNHSIPIGDPDVVTIKHSTDVIELSPDSALVFDKESSEVGAVAGIRMPMLRFSNFKGGTPEYKQTYYAILVLVLWSAHSRSWCSQKIEIVKVVADQVAVALSHAAVWEESQFMTQKLEEQNRDLQQAKRNAMMANQARNSFQKVMCDGMRRPMHSILGLLSILHECDLSNEKQKMIVNTLVKAGSVVSTLTDDVMDISTKGNAKFSLEISPFSLHSAVKELVCLARCLCIYSGFGFSIEVENSLVDDVLGDERRIFQVIFHMVGNLLNGNSANCGGLVTFKVSSESRIVGAPEWHIWRPSSSDGYVNIKFEIRIDYDDTHTVIPATHTMEGTLCENLVKAMRGSISETMDPLTHGKSTALVLRFQLNPSMGSRIVESNKPSDFPFQGLRVLLADSDIVNCAVTRRLMEKLGCLVSAVWSGSECVDALDSASCCFQVVVLDLHMAGVGGCEAARRIRKKRSRSLPPIFIIAVTANAEEDVRDMCVQAGINGVIRKPFLKHRIAELLRRFAPQSKRIS